MWCYVHLSPSSSQILHLRVVLVSGEANTCGECELTQVSRALEAVVVCSRWLRNPGIRVSP